MGSHDRPPGPATGSPNPRSQLGITDLPKSRNQAVRKPKLVVWAAAPSAHKKHTTLPASIPLAIPETDGGMEILSQEQEQNRVQEPIRGTVRGHEADSGQLLLVGNVEAFT